MGKRPGRLGIDSLKYLTALFELGSTKTSWALLHNREFETRALKKLIERGEVGLSVAVFYDLTRHIEWIDTGSMTVEEINFLAQLQDEPDESIMVPVSYVRMLVEFFKEHSLSGDRISAGKIFGLERSGDGANNPNKPADDLRRALRDLNLAREVFRLRAEGEVSGKPFSLERAFEVVADDTSFDGDEISDGVVKAAHRRFGHLVKEIEDQITLDNKYSPEDTKVPK